MAQDYVVGFMYDETLQAVALIRKTKPDWQRGKLNGIGGKIELYETPLQAMRREYREETGVDVPESEWEQVGSYRGMNGTVYVFRAVGRPWDTVTTTEEVVGVYYWEHLDYTQTVPNLRWLLPFCAERTVRSFSVQF